jgi:hypothetical protein
MSHNRSGALALAMAGALFVLYPAVRPWNDESTVAGATASMTSPAWVAAHFFAMLGFILLPLGLLARARPSPIPRPRHWPGRRPSLPGSAPG